MFKKIKTFLKENKKKINKIPLVILCVISIVIALYMENEAYITLPPALILQQLKFIIVIIVKFCRNLFKK